MRSKGMRWERQVRRGECSEGRRESKEDGGAKYLYGIIDRYGRNEEEGGGQHSDIEKGEGMEAEKKRRNVEPEGSIDLDMTNESRLILRHRHPPANAYSCGGHLQNSAQRLKLQQQTWTTCKQLTNLIYTLRGEAFYMENKLNSHKA